MTVYSTELIWRTALKRGTGVWLDFVKSQSIAERIAANTRKKLAEAGVKDADRRVDVRASERFPGTWQVRVNYPPVRSAGPRGAEANRSRQIISENALRASYTHTDLVTSWTDRSPSAGRDK